MSDDLRDLGHRLVADPPHPAPSIDELRDRADRRRQRRARTIGAVSVLVVVVIAGAVLALPRSSELQVGDGNEATSTTATPWPLLATSVHVAVSPESAPSDVTRSVELRNTGIDSQSSCGSSFDLFRWDGDGAWQGVASMVTLDAEPLVLDDYDPLADDRDGQCAAISTLPAGAAVPLGSLDPSGASRRSTVGTAPPTPEPLTEGWYELRQVFVLDGPAAVGRFQITDDADSGPVPSPPAPASDALAETANVDLYPEPLTPSHEVLPTAVVAVDRTTIALAWNSACNAPADHVTLTRHGDEVEVRLTVGSFVVIDCVGETDDWVVTFDSPFPLSDGVRLVARADGVEGETERLPGIIMGSVDSGSQLPDQAPISFRATEITDPAEPGVRFAVLALPYPLAGRYACDVSTSTSNDLVVPEVQIQESSVAGRPPCTDVQTTIRLAPDATLISQP